MKNPLRPLRFSIRRPWSLAAILLYVLTANTLINTRNVYERPQNLLRYDQGGYYSYLPAVWLYGGDFTCSFYDSLGYRSQEFLKDYQGKKFNKYHVGPAVLLAPFFALGHWEALRSGAPTTGFSAPYLQWALIGCYFYVALGLLCLRSLLLRYFDDVVVALSLLALALGTNLLYYSTHEALMSHAYSFFLFALLWYLAVRYWESGRLPWLLATGLVGGLIAATRLPNLVVGLVVVGWGLSSKADLSERLAHIGKFWWHFALASIPFFLGWLPQLLYFKLVHGSWWIHAYAGERFFWDQPLVGRILFSYRKGWLVYTPLMSLALIGFVPLWRKVRPAFWGILLFFLVNLYVVSCWGNWWYGGSYGMRVLIESSAILSFPLAASISAIVHHRLGSYLFTALFPLFIGLSLLQTHQYSHGIIHHDAMTKKAYWAVFGHLHPAGKKVMDRREKYLDRPDYTAANKDREYRGKMR